MATSKPSIVEGHVPVMAMTALDLRRLLGRRTTRNGDLQRVILRDPAAAIALFRYVRRLRRDASDDLSDAGHAVSLVGFDTFRRLLRQVPEIEPDETDGFTPAQHLQSSFSAHAAFYARYFAAQYDLPGADEIATAALLQDPAVLGLWSTAPEAAAHAAAQVRAGRPFEQAYAEQLGESLHSANLWVAEAWGLPSLTVDALNNDPDMDRRARLARLSAELARASGFDWHSRQTEEGIEQLADLLHRPVGRISAQLHRATVQAARELRPVGYPVAAFNCLFLPTKASRHSGAIASATTPVAGMSGTVLDTMQSLLRDAGLQRIAFVSLNRGRGLLRTQLALNVDTQDPLHTLEVSCYERNLFSLLVHKPQAVWLNAGNRARFTTLLTTELVDALHADNCFAMSLFVGGAPMGLIYGDGTLLDNEGYATFRRLVRQAGQRLSVVAA